MDRTAALAGGAMVAILSLGIGSRLSVQQPLPAEVPEQFTEPTRLNLQGVQLRPLPEAMGQSIQPAAFPFSAEDERQFDELELISPAQATPALALPQTSKIELPSALATPAPVESPQISAAPTMAPPSQPPVALPVDRTQPPVAVRPPALVTAVERAEQLTSEGLRLARRGATYSARTQLLQALRQIATAHDEIDTSRSHMQALSAALRAMEESHDFELRHTGSALIDIERTVAAHRTIVLKHEDLTNVTPLTALHRYQLYAVEQLAAAMEREPAASMPLFGLGRINASQNQADRTDTFGVNDTLVWYHAALMTDAGNFWAAHELGSLYAQRGDWEQARAVLQRAVALRSHPVTWANLSVVHGKLGESQLAAAALARSKATAPTPAPAGLPQIQWIDEAAFAQSVGANEVYFAQQTPTEGPPPAAAPGPPAEPRSAAQPKTQRSWLPWGTQRR